MTLNPYMTVFSISVTVVLIVTLWYFKFNPLKMGKHILSAILIKIVNRNVKASVIRFKKARFEKEKESLTSRYQNICEDLIKDYSLPITVDGFNTVVILVMIILTLSVFVVVKSLFLAILTALSVIVAGFTYFMSRARIVESEKIEAIMDAEDILCPLARDGVLIAIKKLIESKEYISPTIRHYFIQFVDNCENHGYTFTRAMEILNRQLGKKFDSFAKKAIIFEYNERKGMADIFLDIIDENATLREINMRKNNMFKKMNKEFFIKVLLVGLFVLYSMTGQDYREFLIGSDFGRVILAFSIMSVCLSYARCQVLQRDIGI